MVRARSNLDSQVITVPTTDGGVPVSHFEPATPIVATALCAHIREPLSPTAAEADIPGARGVDHHLHGHQKQMLASSAEVTAPDKERRGMDEEIPGQAWLMPL